MHVNEGSRKRGMTTELLPRLCVLVGTVILVASCTIAPRTVYQKQDLETAAVLDRTNIRMWADATLEEFRREGFELPPPVGKVPRSYLSLSGGGANGAYGAGILVGWTHSGTRPEFTAVSGVSTGALIAPFAFLGSGYDQQLTTLYTSGIAEDVGRRRPLLASILDSHLFAPEPFRRLVDQFVDESLLMAIAAEHRTGRRLYVVTTNLDAQRPVVWDMGAIAATGHPQTLQVFREVLIASASLPGVFPPVRIPVRSGDRFYEEMHADGGISTQFFAVPEGMLNTAAHGLQVPEGIADLYILMNTYLEPYFEVVDDRLFPIIERSLSTLLQTHARSDLNSTYAFTERVGIGFHLAAVDMSPDKDLGPFDFDTEHMRKLFRSGYERALARTAWSRQPPAARPVIPSH
jgi:hypothetical protein